VQGMMKKKRRPSEPVSGARGSLSFEDLCPRRLRHETRPLALDASAAMLILSRMDSPSRGDRS